MSEWPSVRLDDIADVTVGHVGPMVDEYRPNGVPFLRSQNVRPHLIDWTDMKFIDPDFNFRLGKSLLRPGDVVTVRTGKPGVTAVIPESIPVANCSDLVITRPGPRLDAQWFGYYMNAVAASHVAAHLVGAVQQHFNVGSAKALRVSLPPLRVQLGIAEVLGALDDKIAANARILGASDQFVRARYAMLRLGAEGHRSLGEIATNPRSKAAPSSVAGDSMYVGLEHVPRRNLWLGDHGRADSVSSDKWHFEHGDVLFGKLRPYFHKVVAAPGSGICSTDVLVVRAKVPDLRGLVLAAVSDDGTIKATTAATEGTRMPRTSWKDLAAVQVPWPSESLCRQFSADVTGIAQAAAAIVRESAHLAATRDALLPLLMSGKVTVADAESVVGGVI